MLISKEDKDSNSYLEFISNSCLYTLCVGIWFHILKGMVLYIKVLDKMFMFRESLLAYIAFFIIGLAFYIFLVNGSKNFWTEVLIAIFPCVVFMLLEYGFRYKFLLVIAFVLILVFFWQDMKPIKEKQKKRLEQNKTAKLNYKKIIPKLWKKTYPRLYCALYIYMILFLVFSIVGNWIDHKKTYSSKVEDLEYIAETIYENKDELIKLQQDIYDTLTFEQKVDLLQVVVNIEISYLGCKTVQLCSEDIQNDAVAGYYNSNARQIVIDKDVVNGKYDPIGAMRVVLHEVYHVYEHECIESVDLENVNMNLKFYRDIQIWAEELNDYHDVGDDYADIEAFFAYALQHVEMDADDYSDMRISHYMYYMYYSDLARSTEE